MILGWILRLLVAVLILRAIWRFVAGVLEGMAPPRETAAPGGPGVALVQDPVCGTYVVPSRAVTSGRGESLRYFCSERCRDQYTGDRRLAS
jgi:YHS domain-containing protein